MKKDEENKMIYLKEQEDNKQFLSIQSYCPEIVKQHLMRKFPEIERGIFEMDNEELLLSIYPATENFYTFSLNALKEAISETMQQAHISVIIGNVEEKYHREYLRYI